MAKTNRTSPHKQQFEDEYEDFGTMLRTPEDISQTRNVHQNSKTTMIMRTVSLVSH